MDAAEAILAAVAANPDWSDGLLVAADALDEAGDPRADGYRALGRLRARPWPPVVSWWNWTRSGSKWRDTDDPAFDWYCRGELPSDWFDLLECGVPQVADSDGGSLETYARFYNGAGHAGLATAFSDAAAAFGRLPEDRRRVILEVTNAEHGQA